MRAPTPTPGAGADSAVLLGDLHSFDPITMTWHELSTGVSGLPPAARFEHGFASAAGKLYVHGGITDLGARPCARCY